MIKRIKQSDLTFIYDWLETGEYDAMDKRNNDKRNRKQNKKIETIY